MSNMFCFQCEEASKGVGCDVQGVCGKTPDVANLEDLLVWVVKGLSYYAVNAREAGITDKAADVFVAQAAFTTITNVNFDPDSVAGWVKRALKVRDGLRTKLLEAGKADVIAKAPEPATWTPSADGMDVLLEKAVLVGVKSDPNLNEDIRSLRELLVYGLKGLAAYVDHAYVLEQENSDLFAFLQEGFLAAHELNDADSLVNMVLKCGQKGVDAMALLDKANTGAYGDPEPTKVNIGVQDGPGILISGHDLRDLEELLEQTKGTGVKVYTHGEMLPANAYPAFKKYEHFAGNYGGAWYEQRTEFEKFGGPIIMTTNCVTRPKGSYQDRLFTTGLVAWPGVKHIDDREKGKQKDFSAVIEMAKSCKAPEAIDNGEITIGFAHTAVSKVAGKVIDAVKAGDIKRFVVMGGCDGRHKDREYYTEVAKNLPHDHVILTAGCAKYRYNKLDLGDIGGIPRLLDAGQCNDSYSLVVTALALKDAFGLDDINDLPISYDIAWYEQKAVIVLLALLHLGVKHIRLGPSLPAFITPNVLKVLVDNFDIKPIGEVADDVAAMAAGN